MADYSGNIVANDTKRRNIAVSKWISLAPLVLLAACSKTEYQKSGIPASNPATAAVAPAVAPPPAPGNPEPVAPPAANPYVPPAPRPEPAEISIPIGAHLRVRLDEEVDTRRNRPGDRFSATLYEPVMAHGAVVLPKGARFHGHLVEAKPSGRFRGRAVLGLTLDSFFFHDRTYRVETSGAYRESRSHKRRNLAFIGGGGGFGAAIGAIAGGGAGAAIGALAGGGAGAAGAAITGKKQMSLAAETPLVFTLRAPVRI